MLPPHQRLRTNHLVRPQIDLRLVIPHKLFPVDGVAELSFQDYTFIGAGGQVAGIGLNVIPALFLGVIHRSVRILHQGIGRLSIYSDPNFRIVVYAGSLLSQRSRQECSYAPAF